MPPSDVGQLPSPQPAPASERASLESSSAERLARGRSSGERRAVRPAPIVFAEPLEFLRGFRIEPRRPATLLSRWGQRARSLAGRQLGWLTAGLRSQGDRLALTWRHQGRGETRALAYREFERRSNQLARALDAQGVEPRSRVVVAVSCRPELLITTAALLKLGAEALLAEPSADPEQLVELAPSHAIVGPEWVSALGTFLQWLPRERVFGLVDPERPELDSELEGLRNVNAEALRLPGGTLSKDGGLEETACLCVVPNALPGGNSWAPVWRLSVERWREIGRRFADEWSLSSRDTLYVAGGDMAAVLCGWSAAVREGAALASPGVGTSEAVTEELWRFGASVFLYSQSR